MSKARDRLRTLLRDRAYQEGRFELASGRKSGHYVDAKQVTLDPEGVQLVGDVCFELLKDYDLDAVGGLTLGSDPIAVAVSSHAYRIGRRIPAFIVRKDPKKHGLQKWIEGPLPKHARVAVVDDVITSGKSVLDAITVLEEQGCRVVIVLGLIDRGEGGRETVEARGYQFRAVFGVDEVTAPARLVGSGLRAQLCR